MFPYLSFAYGTDWGILLLRVVVGIIFIVHGLPKLQKPQGMAQGMGWPSAAVTALGIGELFGGALLVLGYFIQPASLALALVMVGALYYKIRKWNAPFTAYDKTGWELDLMLFVATLLIFFSQGGGLGIGL